MKPLGPIPPGYAAIDGELAIGGRKASELVAEAGTPLFVYDGALIEARVAALRAALPRRLGLHYAMKANPFARCCAISRGSSTGLTLPRPANC